MDSSTEPQCQEQGQYQETDYGYHRNGDKDDVLQALQGFLGVLIVIVVAGQGAALPIHAIQFLHIGHNALQLVRVVHIEIPVLNIGGSLGAVEQERSSGEVGKHDIVVKVIGRGHADRILFLGICEDPGHRYGDGLAFVLHIPQQHGVAHRQAVALGEFLMD